MRTGVNKLCPLSYLAQIHRLCLIFFKNQRYSHSIKISSHHYIGDDLWLDRFYQFPASVFYFKRMSFLIRLLKKVLSIFYSEDSSFLATLFHVTDRNDNSTLFISSISSQRDFNLTFKIRNFFRQEKFIMVFFGFSLQYRKMIISFLC